MKLQIIETPDYILAVSDEKTLSINGDYYLDYINNNLHRWNMVGMHKNKAVWINKVITYQPKGNAPELDLPLLPEIVVEDDVEKLADEVIKKEGSIYKDAIIGKQKWIEGYKSATKFYSEDDLRKAIDLSRETLEYNEKRGWYNTMSENEIIQSLKQPTPKYFIAETIQLPNFERSMGNIQNNYVHELKTTTINGKTYLVGTYLYK
jgi:hypothetical protein